MNKYWFKILIINFVILILFSIDRLLRYLALNPAFNSASSPVFFNPAFNPAFFIFNPAFKGGVFAFGLPLPQVLVYTLISAILLILFFLILQAYKRKNLFLIASFTLIFLGSLNNLIDRFSYGYVIDYLNFPPFPIFNLGDIMVVGGVGMIVKSKIKNKKSKIKNKKYKPKNIKIPNHKLQITNKF